MQYLGIRERFWIKGKDNSYLEEQQSPFASITSSKSKGAFGGQMLNKGSKESSNSLEGGHSHVPYEASI
jgi:hypothetical protein